MPLLDSASKAAVGGRSRRTADSRNAYMGSVRDRWQPSIGMTAASEGGRRCRRCCCCCFRSHAIRSQSATDRVGPLQYSCRRLSCPGLTRLRSAQRTGTRPLRVGRVGRWWSCCRVIGISSTRTGISRVLVSLYSSDQSACLCLHPFRLQPP